MKMFKEKKEKVPSPEYLVPSQDNHDSVLGTRDLGLLNSSGFTLVETLVAITILMIAIAGPLTVAEKGLSAVIYARDQLMASYLAQDAMESIKNIVDTNEITSNPGLNYFPSCTNSSIPPSNLCTINTLNGIVAKCSSSNPSSCQALSLTSSGYAQTGISPFTPFTRYFYVQPFNVNGGNAANVTVNVTWPGDVVGGGGVTLEDTIFNVSPQ
jgi:type II secretory pathway pseudopilin PulG